MCYFATEAIATSDGVDDDGLSELNFHDERYLPFGFNGTFSRWRIELPPENNDFDLDTISDVVLKVNYTAREGGQELQKKASDRARKYFPGNGIRYFNIRHEFHDARGVFTCPPLDGYKHREFDVRLSENLFPFLRSCRSVCVKRIHFIIKKDCYAGSNCTGDHIGLSFHPHRRPRDCVGDDNGKREFVCRAAADAEMVFHGFFDFVSPLPLRGYVSEPVGKLEGFRNGYLPVKYVAHEVGGAMGEGGSGNLAVSSQTGRRKKNAKQQHHCTSAVRNRT